MAKRNTSSSMKDMKTFHGMLVAVGIIIGVILTMMYVHSSSYPENLDARGPLSYKTYLTPGPAPKANPKWPKDWKKDETNCAKSRKYWYQFNRAQTGLSKRNASGQTQGTCWNLNDNGQVTHLCCDFKV